MTHKLNFPHECIVKNKLNVAFIEYNKEYIYYNHCDFWKLTESEIYSVFEYIFEKYSYLSYEWVDVYESYFLEYDLEIDSDGKKNIRVIYDVFKYFDKKIIFKTNNLNFDSYKILNHQPILNYIGKNSYKNIEIKQRKFEKHFLYLNRITKEWRTDLWFKMYKNKILKKSYWSINASDENNEIHKSIENVPIIGENAYLDGQLNIISEYFKSFTSIVTETFFLSHPTPVTFITEKTERCLSIGQPFIIASTPKFLKNLQKLGFITFNEWWDESYDDEEDDYVRMDKLTKLCKEISEWSIEKCETVYKEMIPILKHNQQRNKELLKWSNGQYIELPLNDSDWNK